MLGSLFIGVSGVNANSQAMNTIGQNIANANTVGYKSSRSMFADILSQSAQIAAGDNAVPGGVTILDTASLWGQGALESTGIATDLAISGGGLFIVKNPSAETYYTRAGAFNFDANDFFVNPEGLIVQGYEVNADGTLGSVTDIKIPSRSSTPNPTTEITIDMNLDAAAVENDEYSVTMTIYDSLGNAIPMTWTMTKTATAGAWDWDVIVPAAVGTVTGGTGTMTFDGEGALVTGTDPQISLALTNGATTPQAISWDMYDAAGATNGDLTQYAHPSSATLFSQDGYAAGTLQSISVDEEGQLVGSFSNGQLLPFFQIALADFSSYSGLTGAGKGLYEETLASGQPVVGSAGRGGLGSIRQNALEMSNVDLAEEFIKMIIAQRSYQANSRVITTSDEILNELMNIKR